MLPRCQCVLCCLRCFQTSLSDCDLWRCWIKACWEEDNVALALLMSTCSLHASVYTAADLTALWQKMRSLPNIIGISHTHLHRQISDTDTLSRTPFHTHTHIYMPHSLLRLRLRGNRAEMKLRAFTEQGLSGVMATSADLPHPLPSAEREEEKRMEMERESQGGVRTEWC